MEYRSAAGLGGVLSIVGLAIAGLWGVVDGYVVGEPAGVVAPTIATVVLVCVVVGTLVAFGSRSGRRRETPYW